MTNKRFITAKDVVEELGVSSSYAYKLIRKLNAEREADSILMNESMEQLIRKRWFDGGY